MNTNTSGDRRHAVPKPNFTAVPVRALNAASAEAAHRAGGCARAVSDAAAYITHMTTNTISCARRAAVSAPDGTAVIRLKAAYSASLARSPRTVFRSPVHPALENLRGGAVAGQAHRRVRNYLVSPECKRPITVPAEVAGALVPGNLRQHALDRLEQYLLCPRVPSQH